MAKRRMFSMTIVGDDVFLDMPLTSQSLYFHLGMHADDDGFVSPKRIMRMIGASADDLQILIAKRYVLVFDSGVAVVKHWTVNNFIRSDRYLETSYKHEKEKLTNNEWGAYTEKAKMTTNVQELSGVVHQTETNGIPNDNKWYTQVRLGKVNSKVNKTTTNVVAAKKPVVEYGNPKVNDLFKYWEAETELPIKNKVQANRKAVSILLNIYGEDKIKQLVNGAAAAQSDRYAPTITDFCSLKDKANDLIIWGRKRNNSGIEVIS